MSRTRPRGGPSSRVRALRLTWVCALRLTWVCALRLTWARALRLTWVRALRLTWVLVCALGVGCESAPLGSGSRGSGARDSGTPTSGNPVSGNPASGRAEAASGRRSAQAERNAEAARAAAGYLARSCDSNGRFAYLSHLEVAGDSSEGEYNVLRHAGAIYALAQAWERERQPLVRAALLRASRYLIERHLRGWPHRTGLAAIVSLEDEEVGRECAKLGGAGLGLVALCAARRIEPALIELGRLRELGEFVLAAQRADGSFQSKRYLDDGSWGRFQSLYYPGEAILGLLRLSAEDDDPRWLEAAARGAAFLARSRADLRVDQLPHDHWLLIACAELWPRWGDLDAPPLPQPVLRRHLDDLARVFLARQVEVEAEGIYLGAFDRSGSTCPAATRLEGLLAYASLPPSHEGPEPGPLRAGIERGLAFLRGAQLQAPPELRGALPKGWLRGQDPSGERGEVRVDFTQHALSAFLGGALLAEPGASRAR